MFIFIMVVGDTSMKLNKCEKSMCGGRIMNKSIMLAWAIKNSICMICWTYLAIVFDKWWIALFAVLFMSSLTTHHKE